MSDLVQTHWHDCATTGGPRHWQCTLAALTSANQRADALAARADARDAQVAELERELQRCIKRCYDETRAALAQSTPEGA